MAGRPSGSVRLAGRVRLAGLCLVSLLILLALVATACGAGAAATTGSSHGETTSSLVVPVSAGDLRTLWLGTTSTGTGPVDLLCTVTFAGAQPPDPMGVSLYTEDGEFIDGRDGMPYEFRGLQPGKYRVGVFGMWTGYVSQWYGGLPMQGHDISESQVLDLKAGQNAAEFLLQPGLSIRGEILWTGGARLTGSVQAFDLQQRDTGRSTNIGTGEQPLQPATGYKFLIVGLLPGNYKIGVSFDETFALPQFWDGGGSFDDATVIDLTSGDVEGVQVKLGALPAVATATTSLQ